MDAFEKEYSRLSGKTVRRTVCDDGAGTDKVYGLEFTDGTIAWILMDCEGNGPGFLEVQAPARRLNTPEKE
jgi:hypothetical protein